MQARLIGLFLAMLTGMLPLAVFGAPQQATRDDAIRFVGKAVAHIRQHGKERALQDFNNAHGPFVERELYIVVLDMNGTLLADGLNPKLVNKSLRDVRDINGKYFVREELKLAIEKGKGWVDFHWPNPASGALETRSSYFERVDDYIVLTGVYQQR
ncbi:MAG: cache domain-containing protein [Pseudomonadota bacterium]